MPIQWLADKLFIPKMAREGVEREDYIRLLDSGIWKDKFVYGISKKIGDFACADPVQQPGAAFIGGMGSGKSVAMRFTMSTHLACNSEDTMYIAIDTFKGMNDYEKLWKYKNVVKALGQEEKFITIMDMVWAECMKRKDEFDKVTANNIYTYEKRTGKKIARIVICIEEFHAITSSKVIDYHNNCDKEGTAAWQLLKLMRIARSYGIFFMIATQRATYDDIPSNLKTGITQWNVFKVNNQGDAAAANLPQAADIPGHLRGRCITENGWVQFPYIELDLQEILDTRIKPFSAKLFAYSLDEYHKAAAANGNSGMIWVKPLSFIISSYNQFNLKDVAKRIFEIFGFSTEEQTNGSLVADMVAAKDGQKYAVVLHKAPVYGRGRSSDDDSKKSPEGLKDSLPILKLKQVISMSFGGDDPMRGLVEDLGGYSVGSDDLKRIGEVFDAKDSFKNEAEYQALFNKLVLAKKPTPSPDEEEPMALGVLDVAEKSEEEAPKEDLDDELAAIRKKFQKRSKIIVE